MGENSKTPPGAKALISAIDARLDEIDVHQKAFADEAEQIGTRLRALMKEMRALEGERGRLNFMKRQYQGHPAKNETKAKRDERPGATKAIFDALRRASGHRFPASLLIQHLEAGIAAGAIRTDTSDPRKLASSVVGNLVRAGRLRREGDFVVLAENGTG